MQNEEGKIRNLIDISLDEDIQSLFNKCESIDMNNPQKIQQSSIPNFSVRNEDIRKGYDSDQEIYVRKRKQIVRNRRVIVKKQKPKKKSGFKHYIKILENKVLELKIQIENLQKLNKINKQYIHRLNQSEQIINGYFVGRQQIIQKLEILNSNPQVDSKKIFDQISILRLRQGVYGKDRTKAVNYYFTEMVQMILPELQKYLIKTAIEQEDFFDVSYLKAGVPAHSVEDWRKNILYNIGSGIKQQNAKWYLYNNRKDIIRQAEKFKEILSTFSENKDQLSQQAKKLQEALDGAHKFMRPLEISKSICYIDKYRFQKNIRLQHTFRQIFTEMERKTKSYEVNKSSIMAD